MSQQLTVDHLHLAADYMQDYLKGLKSRRVAPTPEQVKQLDVFDIPLPDSSSDPKEVLNLLHEYGSPATVASAGGRYFGYVIGSALPAALAAYCLAGAWDQCAGLHVLSPTGEKLEQVAGNWLKQSLGLPMEAGTGFVTGATMANFTGLAAARHALLKQLNWNVEANGLYGAPEIKVVVGDEVHVSVLKALSLLGFGSERITRIPVDAQGRMKPQQIEIGAGPTIVCLQAGNVDSGAIDPMHEIIPKIQRDDVWVHIDGAFGLWAAATPTLSHLVQGAVLADSWAVDLHKWLNVPYDSGVVICRDPQHLRASMSVNAAYLPPPGSQGPYQYTPGMSRRARGVDAYAALYSLGRSGLAELIEKSCRHARHFAKALQEAGYQILNEVVLNQVLVDFGDHTDQIMESLQKDGTCWVAGTTWQGKNAMRISVSSWATTDDDVERSLAAMISTASDLG
ncbi:MAG: aminotransferase class V-fold PLP-dependent enzyme [Cyclobacteriaceae bacterium]|nr:aminotransferase class V-fold PLP-dependent enzyme [Cyclobacteriaceae bacterium]